MVSIEPIEINFLYSKMAIWKYWVMSSSSKVNRKPRLELSEQLKGHLNCSTRTKWNNRKIPFENFWGN